MPEYNDQAHKIFFNTTADLSKLPQTQRNMLEYIHSGVAEDIPTQSLDAAVKEARLKEEWREEYMLTVTYRNEIYTDGVSEGLSKGRIEIIHTFLSNGGSVDDAKRLLNATDEEVATAKQSLN